jgi:hypothetical protein
MSTASTVQLFHPRGPAVHLVIPDDPQAALARVNACLDAGWLAKETKGEIRVEIGHVARGSAMQDGKPVPYVLLYKVQKPNRYCWLKVYLDAPAEIAAFESASKMKLATLPEYEGRDKPELGACGKIIRAPRPFAAIYEDNPDFSEAEAKACSARREVYKVPARVFLRWENQLPATPSQKPTNSTPAVTQQPPQPPCPATAPAKLAPAPERSQTSPPDDLTAQHARFLREVAQAGKSGSKADIDAIQRWAKKIAFTQGQYEEQDHALEDAMDLIAQRAVANQPPPRRPAQQSA